MKIAFTSILFGLVMLMSGTSNAQLPNPSIHHLTNWDRKFGEPVYQKLEVAWDDLLDFQAADFDEDGAIDLFYADSRGSWVCWGNGGGGLGSAVPLTIEKDSIIQIAFNSNNSNAKHPQLLWTRTQKAEGQDLIKSWVFEGRECKLLSEFGVPSGAILRSVDSGLLMGPLAGGEVVLEHQGARLILAQWNESLEGLDLADLDGNGFEDLVIHSGDRIAVGFGNEHGFESDFSFIPLTQSISSWDVNVDVLGQRGIIVKREQQTRVGLWTYESGNWNSKELDRFVRGEVINHQSEQYSGVIMKHQPVNQALIAIPFQFDGRSYPAYSLAEIADGEFIKLRDWNLDGLDDVIVLDEQRRELIWIPNFGFPYQAEDAWSRHVLEVFLDSMPGDFELPYATSKEWRRGSDWLDGIKEWMIAEEGVWGLGAKEMVHAIHRVDQREYPPFTREDSSHFEPCIKVGYIAYQDAREGSCFGIDKRREWHRLTYSRDRIGGTLLVIDDELRFEGYTASRRFDHRWLQLGAGFGVKWRGYAEVDLDDIFIYEDFWRLSEILKMQASGEHLLSNKLKVQLDFDGLQGLELLPAGEPLNFEGGAKLIPMGSGRAARFDGISGKSHVFCDIPDEEIVVDFRFRLPKTPSRFGVMVNLYGMFNMAFTVGKGLPFEGVASSPTKYLNEVRADQDGGHLVTWQGRVHRLLPTGAWKRWEENDWMECGSTILPPDGLSSSPWVQGKSLFVKVGRGGEVWSCSAPDQPWTYYGTLNSELSSFEHISANGKWALIWDDDLNVFGWLETKSRVFYPQSRAVLPTEIIAVRPAMGGVEFQDSSSKWWLIPSPSAEDSYFDAFEHDAFPWAWSLAILLLLAAVLYRVLSSRKGAVAVHNEVPPEVVLRLLMRLHHSAGQLIDVHEFDVRIGLDEIETDETRRSRRSRAINEVNQWSELQHGESWIRRKRDPSDRRRLLYYISEQVSYKDWSSITEPRD